MPRCINHQGFDNGKPSKADRRASERERSNKRNHDRTSKFSEETREVIAPRAIVSSVPRQVIIQAHQKPDNVTVDETEAEEVKPPRVANRFAALGDDSDSD